MKTKLKSCNSVRVCVATTVHYALDTRIFFKEVKALSEKYVVDYYAKACSDVTCTMKNVIFYPLHKMEGKFGRVIRLLQLSFITIRKKYAIYHFHDPDLLLLAILLKFLGRKVVFDMHEDISKDILTKTYLTPFWKMFFYYAYRGTERIAVSTLDWFVLAEDSYINNFDKKQNVTVIHNYPIIRNIHYPDHKKWPNGIVYVGSIVKNRGALQMLYVLHQVKVRIPDVSFHLIGPIEDAGLEDEMIILARSLNILDSIHFYGRIPNERIYSILTNCRLGLCLLDGRNVNYKYSLPTKLFEYMLAKIPFVTTDFELYRKIVNDCQCGKTIDYNDIGSIGDACVRLLNDMQLNSLMGCRGYNALKNEYNWDNEKLKLVEIYERLI